jgi:hypothetical protein
VNLKNRACGGHKSVVNLKKSRLRRAQVSSEPKKNRACGGQKSVVNLKNSRLRRAEVSSEPKKITPAAG